MEAENKLALRRVYASALPAYIDRWERSIFNSPRRLRFNSFRLLTARMFVCQDGRGCLQTPAAAGASGAGIPGGQRPAWRGESAEGPGDAAENHQSGLATVS